MKCPLKLFISSHYRNVAAEWVLPGAKGELCVLLQTRHINTTLINEIIRGRPNEKCGDQTMPNPRFPHVGYAQCVDGMNPPESHALPKY